VRITTRPRDYLLAAGPQPGFDRQQDHDAIALRVWRCGPLLVVAPVVLPCGAAGVVVASALALGRLIEDKLFEALHAGGELVEVLAEDADVLAEYDIEVPRKRPIAALNSWRTAVNSSRTSVKCQPTSGTGPFSTLRTGPPG
jgi:hypothetical protein